MMAAILILDIIEIDHILFSFMKNDIVVLYETNLYNFITAFNNVCLIQADFCVNNDSSGGI